MPNFENFDQVLYNFIRKLRSIVRLNRLWNPITADDVIVYKVCCFTGCSSFSWNNLWPPSQIVNGDYSVLVSLRIFRKGPNSIYSPMFENIVRSDSIIGSV